ncbi:MAG: ribosome-associated translation inhibitor RaiA [Candidatus Hydrogenedentes bacterium]|nr:ribosome-associated translation inhibitor RaiA [Candidatus Hydrogenedentota bacterium]
MQKKYTARHMELTDDLKEYIEKRFQKITALVNGDESAEARIVLTKESTRCLTEITVSARGFTVTAKHETPKDIRVSVDDVIDKIVRQIKKKKEKVGRHQPLTARELRAVAHHIVTSEPQSDEDDENNSDSGFQFVRRESLPVKPMSVDEALMQLAIADESFLVFSNAETEEINVVYDRQDGTYGLVEPGF